MVTVGGGGRPSELFDWFIEEDQPRKVKEEQLFEAMIRFAPGWASRIVFDPSTGGLIMPPAPTAESAHREWKYVHAKVVEQASALRGAPVMAFVRIAEVFRFRWSRFEDEHWRRLSQVYAGLPCWMGDGFDLPRWFGINEGHPPYLWATVEGFGLEVGGVTSATDYVLWREALIAGTDSLPRLSAPAELET